MEKKIFKCLVASPGDTKAERESCVKVFEELNKGIGESFGFVIEKRMWEHNTRPSFGDYSQVSLDPTNSQRFYVINQFADFFNNAAGGNPTGNGASRYGTFIGIIGIDAIGGGGGVPEPATWAMMIMGFGFVGNAARRRRTRVNVTFA